MIEVKNHQIQEPVIDILYDLRRDLLKNNINKLNDIIIKGSNALITCPEHKDGQESHPSCYVRLTEGDGVQEGCVHCFTCGYKTTLPIFISNCFGIYDQGEYGEKWLLDHCPFAYLTERRLLNKIKPKIVSVESKPVKYVSEEELQSYRYYHPYMYERKLTDEIINKFDIGFDKKCNCITFPVYNKENKCLFVVKRNIAFKKFYIPEGVDKEIFGINQIPEGCNEVVICESVFNALTCWVYGKVGIALFGTGSKQQIEVLKKLNVRKYILAFDGDEAGQKATNKFKKALSYCKIISIYHLPQGKDINDLSKEEFDKLKFN